MTDTLDLSAKPALSPLTAHKPVATAPASAVPFEGYEGYTSSAPYEGLVLPFGGTPRLGLEYGVVYAHGAHGDPYLNYDAISTYRRPDLPSLKLRMDAFSATSVHVIAHPAGVGAWNFFYTYISPFLESPWGQKAVFLNNLSRWIESFPVPSKTVPGLVAYFQDTNKRVRDIQTPIKPGKYLKKFFGDLLSEDEIHEMALEWSNAYAVRELKVTQNADEIERVYRGKYNGSCMHFGTGAYAGNEHPARVYAGPDLGIAYIGDIDNVDGRCLVWPSKKIFFGKYYGDGCRMEAALLAKGWTEAEEDAFEGARLQRIPYGYAFILPYLDTADNVTDSGTWLIIDDRGEIGARNTHGLSDGREVCDACGDTCDDRTYVEGTDDHVCAHCLEANYFFCEETEEYWPDYDMIRVESNRIVRVSEQGADRAVNRGRLFFCELSETYYDTRDYDSVMLTDERLAEADHAAAQGYFCEYSEQWSVDFSARQELSDGTFVDTDMTNSDFNLWLAERGVTLIGAISDTRQTEMVLAA